MNQKRICRIQVKKLFGNINYDIDLTVTSPIAIITAPNGCGKTTILNLVSFIFEPASDTFRAIRNIPFEEFRCILSNGKTIMLRNLQYNEENSCSHQDLIPRSLKEEVAIRAMAVFENADFELSIIGKSGDKQRKIVFSKEIQKIFGAAASDYYDVRSDDYPFFRSQNIPTGMRLKYFWERLHRILEEKHCGIPVNFIRADRIQPIMITPRRVREYDEPHPESPLKIASENISNLIKDATERYNEAVSQAKDKLPQMFLDGEGNELDSNEFMEGWSVYRKELNQFQEIGLITPTEDFTRGKDISKVYKEKGRFLSTYLSAFKDTTAPLQDIYNRLNLFKQILDERNAITKKKVVFGRDGISLSSGGRKIDLETLSSGEKHDFIMFYNLIFNVKKDGLVLVDEPEISLHIEWQETYLDKLLAICEMNGLQAIVATHSPNIVSSHYEFLVDKGEIDG